MANQVATGSGRVNSSGQFPPVNAAGQSFSYVNVVAAGGSLTVPIAGTQFYVVFASAPLTIKPYGNGFGSDVVYTQGTGQQFSDAQAFSLLAISNPSAGPVVFQLFIGFNQFIDRRLIIENSLQQQVTNPTQPTASTATAIAIPDLSGQTLTDINGIIWYAVQRVCIFVFNVSTGTTLLLQKAGAASSSGPAIAAIYPQTSVRIDTSGNYSMSVGGGVIPAIVSELYIALPSNA